MAMFNNYVKSPEGNDDEIWLMMVTITSIYMIVGFFSMSGLWLMTYPQILQRITAVVGCLVYVQNAWQCSWYDITKSTFFCWVYFWLYQSICYFCRHMTRIRRYGRCQWYRQHWCHWFTMSKPTFNSRDRYVIYMYIYSTYYSLENEHNYGNQHVQWVNPLFLWPFSSSFM